MLIEPEARFVTVRRLLTHAATPADRGLIVFASDESAREIAEPASLAETIPAAI